MSWLGAGPTWLTLLALLRALEGLWWRAKILEEIQETWRLATTSQQVGTQVSNTLPYSRHHLPTHYTARASSCRKSQFRLKPRSIVLLCDRGVRLRPWWAAVQVVEAGSLCRAEQHVEGVG